LSEEIDMSETLPFWLICWVAFGSGIAAAIMLPLGFYVRRKRREMEDLQGQRDDKH
jgi:hypothetical protein